MKSRENKLPLKRSLVLLSSLAIAWTLWSGLYKPLLLALGALSCVLTFWIVLRMKYFDEDMYALRFSFRLFRYWIWLGGEIIRSSIQVARIILDPKLPISPRVVNIKPESKHPIFQVILGNSITLTPGSLTVDVHENIIKAHALTEEGARELEAGEMNQRVSNIRKDQ